MSGALEPSVLDTDRRAVLATILDTLLPAVDDLPSATQLGALAALEAALADVDWNGERWYGPAPHEAVPHPGHGWQGDAPPAELLGRVLDVLGERLAASGPQRVIEDALADRIDLEGISSADFVNLLRRHLLVQATGVTVR